MNAENEILILERLKKLEDDLDRIKRISRLDLSADEAAKKFLELIDDIDYRSLQRIFREVPAISLAPMFYGAPRTALEKFKKSVSKTIWRESVDSWSTFGRDYNCPRYHNDFIRIVRQLGEMGEVVIAGKRGREVALEEPIDREKFYEDQKLEREIEKKRWITEELTGL